MRYPKTPTEFTSWLPSTWPPSPVLYNDEFGSILSSIFNDSLLNEINNVISDVLATNGNLNHRGHVLLLSMLCAIDALASYAFSDITGKGSEETRCTKFIECYFPNEYLPFASSIYGIYRTSLVHSWNLFRGGVLPGHETICESNGTLQFGLLNFSAALNQSVDNLTRDLSNNKTLQVNCINRYTQLRQSALR